MILIDNPPRDIPATEFFDNRTSEFIRIPETHVDAIYLKMEHSLMSVAEWEGIWHVPFTGEKNLTGDKLLSYLRCMTINPPKNPEVYNYLTKEDLDRVGAYISDPKSAWEIKPKKGPKPRKGRKNDTAEAIYFAMVEYGLPIEVCQKWHFNRLLALLDYCESKGGNGGKSGKSRSQKEMMAYYHELNMANRKRFNSKG